MDKSELAQKSKAELQDILLELLREKFNLHMQRGTGQLARPHLMRNVRKNIARVKTKINDERRR